MKSLKESLLLVIGLTFLLGSGYLFLQKPAPARYQHNSILRVGEQNLILEIADTDAARTQGLSGRGSLADDHGMLFIFDEPARYGFWMKEMLFPIDIVWIDADRVVVEIEKNVSPESYPQIFYPETLIKYAIELHSGEAEKLGIDIGEKLYLDQGN